MNAKEELSDSPSATDSLQRAFARALGAELDRIGYPAAPSRTQRLRDDLGVSKIVAYRIGRGENMPSLTSLLKLQSMGISLDAVLDALQGRPKGSPVLVEIMGALISAWPIPARGRTQFVIANEGDRAVLRVLKNGEDPGSGTPIGGLRFVGLKPSIAIVDDSTADLTVLRSQLIGSFDAQGYERGQDLLEDVDRLKTFAAVVLDWRLPDIDGAELIKRIRSHTQVPIILITGEPQASKAISQALRQPDIAYVAKPVDEDILQAMIETAISTKRGLFGS